MTKTKKQPLLMQANNIKDMSPHALVVEAQNIMKELDDCFFTVSQEEIIKAIQSLLIVLNYHTSDN